MKLLAPYRLATYLLALFCLGHTFGGMLSQRSLGTAADAVLVAMRTVHVDFNGSDCTFYGMWLGFGLATSLLLLLSAVTAWTLAVVQPAAWRGVAPIAWALFGVHVANALLTWRYFFTGAALLATVIAVLLGVGAWRKSRAAAAPAAEA